MGLAPQSDLVPSSTKPSPIQPKPTLPNLTQRHQA
jgi:hypothetical protein